jgi:hypothetical protein
MAELILEHSTAIRTPDGERFTARVFANQRRGGTWEAWIEFVPVAAAAPVLRTDRETTQPSRDAVDYWAKGLEPVYLEGAFARASIRDE